MTDRIDQVDASPVKRFFIDIITRDIPITAAILDLVDNSVDSARSMRPDGDLSGLRVDIVASEAEFSIEDNCAGIGAQNAKTYVFRMGRPDEVSGVPGSIGQFGVGMKRALFKLGSSIIVESTTATDGFTIELPVERWMAEDAWTFPMTVHDPTPAPKTGTTIIVTDLHQQVSSAFDDELFLASLMDELQSRHRLAVGNGLTITLNGIPVSRADSTVAMSDLLAPAVRSLSVATPQGATLSVRIVAGVAARPDSGVDEDGEPEEQSRAAADAGWLVFGNGRLLLANDQTSVTGWGSGRKNMPQFHNQFARFRGFVYMESSDPNAIPWNTMKTSVDPDSVVWSQVVAAMIAAGRGIIDLLNQAKVERKFAGTDDATPILDALRGAVAVDASDAFEAVGVQFSITMDELRGGITVAAAYPEPNPDLVAVWKKIQYAVEASAFDEIADALGTDNAAEIGRQSFDDFHAKHVRR